MSNEVTVVEQSAQDTALYLITKAEVDQQISTAKAFPRSVTAFREKAMSMATLTEDIAASCSYSMPRAGKALEGPSVRLAEIVVANYGNVRAAARVIDNDGKTVTAQGICHDLESNYCTTVEVKKRITDKHGKTFSEDMQVVTGNAACAIAFRNAVFKVIPAALVTDIYEQAKLVAKGTAQTLVERRTKAVAWFTEQGIKPAQICAVLEIKKVDDIDLDKLSVLSGMRSAVKNGESTLKELFDPEQPAADTPQKPTLTDEEVAGAINDGLTLDQMKDNYNLTEGQIKLFES